MNRDNRKRGKGKERRGDGLEEKRGEIEREMGKSRGKKKEDSDEEADEVVKKMKSSESKVRMEHFEVFDSESRDEEPAEEEEEEREEREKEVHRDREVTKRQVKDIHRYQKVLERLEMKRSGLSEEGERYLNEYKSMVCTYMLYVMFNMGVDDKSHPVMRRIKDVYMKMKGVDDIADRLLSHIRTFHPHTDDYDDTDHINHIDDDEEEEEESEKNTTMGKKVREKRRDSEGRMKKKVRTFKLDMPTSYSDIHRRLGGSEGSDSEDDLLNLGKRREEKRGEEGGLKSMIEGDITMEDMAGEGGKRDRRSVLKGMKVSEKGRSLYRDMMEKRREGQEEEKKMRGLEREEIDRFERKLMFNERRVGTDQPRTVTEEMMLNRGLRKKRERVISKVKIRRKYEKAKLRDRVGWSDSRSIREGGRGQERSLRKEESISLLFVMSS